MKKILLVVLACAVLSGCATTITIKDAAKHQITFLNYSKGAINPKPDGYPIELFFNDEKPKKQYKIIGEIQGEIGREEDIRPMLEEKVRQVGGDGLIEIQMGQVKNIISVPFNGMALPTSVTTSQIKGKIIQYIE